MYFVSIDAGAQVTIILLACELSRPSGSRSDPIGGSEPKSGARDYLYYIYILYCTGTLIDMFFLRVVPVSVVYKQFL